jgi:leucyl aminopeptidase
LFSLTKQEYLVVDLLKSATYAAQNFLQNKKTKIVNHRVVFWPARKPAKPQVEAASLKRYLKSYLTDWQLERVETVPSQSFQIEGGELWVLNPSLFETKNQTTGHQGKLSPSKFGSARDMAGSWLRTSKSKGHIEFDFVGTSDSEICGALVGLGLASYNFLAAVKNKDLEQSWSFLRQGKPFGKSSEKIFSEAYAIYSGMNLARHLTNMPAEKTNPHDLSLALVNFFKKSSGVKTEIYSVADLEKEKLGLLLGVGQGSATGARLLHLKYRPKSAAKKRKPIALVGKGVTFDTGGLDIKPSSGMRLMKKDMAGAAAVAGLCHFASLLKLSAPLNFYLPLAENCVSDRATRPGDVHVAGNGSLVEIDNTDAEGRLVMADAIYKAISASGNDAPKALIDVSTLTGAMRVAVGLDVAGYFSNDDKMAKDMEVAAQDIGEMVWRMPLVQKYNKFLTSSFADFKNSSDSGYGGAITAALFLEKFVGETPWLHFDVMSWNLSSDGAYTDGANAQCFQSIAAYLLKQR